MKKKADVNWLLISMVIAVIALAITAYIFWKYSTQSANQAAGIASCQARGGHCVFCGTDIPNPYAVGGIEQPSCKCESGEVNLGQYSCGAGYICCIPPQSGSE